MKQIIAAILILLFSIGIFLSLHLFVIGEPVDGDQLLWEIEEGENSLNIRISMPESAIALRGLKLRQNDGTWSVSLRKVLVSPLFSSGTVTVRVHKQNTDAILLGGKQIWSSQ